MFKVGSYVTQTSQGDKSYFSFYFKCKLKFISKTKFDFSKTFHSSKYNKITFHQEIMPVKQKKIIPYDVYKGKE